MMGTWLVEWSGAYVQPTKLDAFPFFFPFHFLVIFVQRIIMCYVIQSDFCCVFFCCPPVYRFNLYHGWMG